MKMDGRFATRTFSRVMDDVQSLARAFLAEEIGGKS